MYVLEPLMSVLCRTRCDMIFLLECTVGYTWAITTCGGTTGMSSWHRGMTPSVAVWSVHDVSILSLVGDGQIRCFVVGGVWVDPSFCYVLFCGLVMFVPNTPSDFACIWICSPMCACLCDSILTCLCGKVYFCFVLNSVWNNHSHSIQPNIYCDNLIQFSSVSIVIQLY